VSLVQLRKSSSHREAPATKGATQSVAGARARRARPRTDRLVGMSRTDPACDRLAPSRRESLAVRASDGRRKPRPLCAVNPAGGVRGGTCPVACTAAGAEAARVGGRPISAPGITPDCAPHKAPGHHPVLLRVPGTPFARLVRTWAVKSICSAPGRFTPPTLHYELPVAVQVDLSGSVSLPASNVRGSHENSAEKRPQRGRGSSGRGRGKRGRAARGTSFRRQSCSLPAVHPFRSVPQKEFLPSYPLPSHLIAAAEQAQPRHR